MQQDTLIKSPSRISRDEMNLAEFPLTVLSTRASPGIKTLEFSDSIRSKTGETINRKWIITGADKFGLPTASDDEVLLGLLKLTVDQGFEDEKVFFTRYELLKILQWTTEGRSYVRLQKALDRLSGVRIKATNAFYDNSVKAHSTKNFGIIDAYELNDGKGGKTTPSFFIWSEALFKSFQVGFIKKLDLSFYLLLSSAVTKRLYRYLDKHFWYKNKLSINLFTLVHEKLGISRNYRYVSSVRQQLDPALDELIEKGFLSQYEYRYSGPETEVSIFAASSPRAIEAPKPIEPSRPTEVMLDLKTSTDDDRKFREVRIKLVERGLKERQAERLLKGKPKETILRIEKIISHFDRLISSKSRLVSVSPVGFLYRAVENPFAFNLPDDVKSPASTVGFTSQSREKRGKKAGERESLESEYLIDRKHQIKKLFSRVEEVVLKKIRKEVEDALHKLKGLISEDRLREAVDLGVEEKLAKLFLLPTYEEWLKGRQTQRTMGG